MTMMLVVRSAKRTTLDGDLLEKNRAISSRATFLKARGRRRNRIRRRHLARGNRPVRCSPSAVLGHPRSVADNFVTHEMPRKVGASRWSTFCKRSGHHKGRRPRKPTSASGRRHNPTLRVRQAEVTDERTKKTRCSAKELSARSARAGRRSDAAAHERRAGNRRARSAAPRLAKTVSCAGQRPAGGLSVDGMTERCRFRQSTACSDTP